MVPAECSSLECQCQPPYQIVDGNCIVPGCDVGGVCPGGAECVTIAGGISYCACPHGFRPDANGICQDINECLENRHMCSYGAECVNQPGAHQCVCPLGTSGDPYHGVCSPNQVRCVADNDCLANEKCVQPGECVCPPPFFTDALDSNKCKSPCERFPCGINARCTPSDPPRCLCEAGFKGDPLHGCVDVDECAENPCAAGAHCINEKGSYKCVCSHGLSGDPYRQGCEYPTPVWEDTARRNPVLTAPPLVPCCRRRGHLPQGRVLPARGLRRPAGLRGRRVRQPLQQPALRRQRLLRGREPRGLVPLRHRLLGGPQRRMHFT